MRMFLDSEGRQMGLSSDLIPEVEEVSRALGTSSLSLHIDEDGVFSMPASGVLANDADVDGDGLIATLSAGATNGVAMVSLDGSCSYTPNADFHGVDS